MKKVVAFILSIVMVMGLFAGCKKTQAPTATDKNPTATEGARETTSAAEESLVETTVAADTNSGKNSENTPALTEKSNDDVVLYGAEDTQELSEDVLQRMESAEEALKNVDTQGLALKYFFYTDILSGTNNIPVQFEPIPHNEILFMQYIDGMWIPLEHSVGEDGTITLPEVANAPLSIFMDGLDSPGGRPVDLTAILTDESYLFAQIHSTEEAAILSEDVQNRLAEAKAALKDACPEGFSVKYFFELEITGEISPVSVDFEPIDHNEIVFMQYVDGAWVELEHSVAGNGIITVSGLVNGPVAVFTK